jgi:hypothetical protein
VALVRDIVTDEPIAIHRTPLSVDCRKLDRPRVLGPKKRRDQAVAGRASAVSWRSARASRPRYPQGRSASTFRRGRCAMPAD